MCLGLSTCTAAVAHTGTLWLLLQVPECAAAQQTVALCCVQLQLLLLSAGYTPEHRVVVRSGYRLSLRRAVKEVFPTQSLHSKNGHYCTGLGVKEKNTL